MRTTLLLVGIFHFFCFSTYGQNLASLQKGWGGLGYSPDLTSHSELERELFKEWAKEGKPDELWLLIAADSEAAKADYEVAKAKRQKMINDLEKQKIRGRRNVSQLFRIQRYLKKHFLQTYDPFASYWDMFSSKRYNSAIATLLYSEVFTHFDIPHERWSNAVYSYIRVDPSAMDEYIDPLDQPEDESLDPMPFDLPLQEKTEFLAYARMGKFIAFDSLNRYAVDNLVYQYYQPEERIERFQLAGLQYFFIGKGLYWKGQYEKAIPFFEKAFLLYPVLASKYYAYKSHVGMLGGRDLTKVEDVDLLTKIYRMLPSQPAEEAILVSFQKILLNNMVNGDNEEFVVEVKDQLMQSEVSDQIKAGVATIYYREKAKEAAKDGDYSQARDFMENMQVANSEDQMLANVVIKNFYNQLEDCTLRELLWKEDKEKYPFLEKQPQILSLVNDCEQGTR